MKKIGFILIIVVSLCSGCTIGNKEVVDVTYTFNKAICKIGGEYQEIELKKWTDYEGEQVQIWDKKGKYYLLSSVNCTLISE
ncbi:MAG: hypothetical protein HFH08_05825 [Bacilli bacterium]|nr:hypothetical protein [Bacilli bacterium]